VCVCVRERERERGVHSSAFHSFGFSVYVFLIIHKSSKNSFVSLSLCMTYPDPLFIIPYIINECRLIYEAV